MLQTVARRSINKWTSSPRCERYVDLHHQLRQPERGGVTGVTVTDTLPAGVYAVAPLSVVAQA